MAINSAPNTKQLSFAGSSAERHADLDLAILSKRDETYQKAKLKNPGRWRWICRNWDFISEVKLNPEKEAA
jgi:putative transposase